MYFNDIFYIENIKNPLASESICVFGIKSTIIFNIYKKKRQALNNLDVNI